MNQTIQLGVGLFLTALFTVLVGITIAEYSYSGGEKPTVEIVQKRGQILAEGLRSYPLNLDEWQDRSERYPVDRPFQLWGYQPLELTAWDLGGCTVLLYPSGDAEIVFDGHLIPCKGIMLFGTAIISFRTTDFFFINGSFKLPYSERIK